MTIDFFFTGDWVSPVFPTRNPELKLQVVRGGNGPIMLRNPHPAGGGRPILFIDQAKNFEAATPPVEPGRWWRRAFIAAGATTAAAVGVRLIAGDVHLLDAATLWIWIAAALHFSKRGW